MSGFVVGFGKPEKNQVERAFARIRHRGPDASGLGEAFHGRSGIANAGRPHHARKDLIVAEQNQLGR